MLILQILRDYCTNCSIRERVPAVELAAVLAQLARSVSLPKLQKHPRGPKKPKPKKQSGAKIKHVATARILEARRKCT